MEEATTNKIRGTNIDLREEDWINALESVFHDIVVFDDIPGAANFYRNLEELIQYHIDNHREIPEKNLRRCQQMIDLSKIIASTTVPDKELVSLIDKYIKTLLGSEDIDLWDKFREKLRSILILEDRDALKQEMRERLLKNETIITKQKLILGGNLVDGSVSNWLRYYNSALGIGIVGNIKLREFIEGDKNIEKLLPEERRRVEKLFYFYEKLKRSSFSFEGIEDQILVDDGKTQGWIQEGEFTIYKPSAQLKKRLSIANDILRRALGGDYYKFFGGEKIIEEKDKPADDGTSKDKKDQLLSNYRVASIDWGRVQETAKKIQSQFKRFDVFRKNFHGAINRRDKERILASLLVLAKQGKLDEIFEIDEKIRDIFAQHLQKKFSEKLAQHFLQNLRDPVYISYFLQHLLKDILKLDENESAVIAIKLANELKRAGDKEYLAIAYGDLSDGTFKWKTIIEEDAKLTLADK